MTEALQLAISECKPKAKIVDICEKGDSYIREYAFNDSYFFEFIVFFWNEID
jgi:methionine aminopeptidase